MQAESTIVLLDIDNTTINSAGELNEPLLNSLKRFHLTHIILFSTYDLTYGLKRNVQHNTTRWQVVCRLKQLGFSILDVVISRSPYYGLQAQDSYYHRVIQPIEQQALWLNAAEPPEAAVLDRLLLEHDAKGELANITASVSQPYQGIDYWPEEAFKGGKQHLLTYAIHRFKVQQGKAITGFIVLDDKREVIEVVKRAANEQIYGTDITLHALEVQFNQLHQAPAQVYEEFFVTTCQLIAFPANNPLFAPLAAGTQSGLYLVLDDTVLSPKESATVEKVLFKGDWLNDYDTIYLYCTAEQQAYYQVQVEKNYPELAKRVTYVQCRNEPLSWLETWASLQGDNPQMTLLPLLINQAQARWFDATFHQLHTTKTLSQLFNFMTQLVDSLRDYTKSSLFGFFHPHQDKRLEQYLDWLQAPVDIAHKLRLIVSWFYNKKDKPFTKLAITAWQKVMDKQTDLRAYCESLINLPDNDLKTWAIALNEAMQDKDIQAASDLFYGPLKKQSSSSSTLTLS